MSKHVRALLATIADDLQVHIIAEVCQEVVASSTNAFRRICPYDELPDWMKIDLYIRRGYRLPTNSFFDCLLSLCYPHNEFVNMWSHLLPAIFLVLLLGLDLWVFGEDLKVPIMDKYVFQFYICCTVCCLLLSAFYHCINSHSEQISRRFLKCDYFGIELSIIATNVSSAYFGLDGNLSLQVTYIALLIVCSILVFHHLLRENIDGPGAANSRVMMLGALASTGFALRIYAYCWMNEGLQGFSTTWDGVMILLDLIAVFFYLTHIPEKWWPHTFDIWGASHQIFHLFICAGQLAFLMGLREVMLRRCLHVGGLEAYRLSQETSLSLWIDPSIAIQSGV